MVKIELQKASRKNNVLRCDVVDYRYRYRWKPAGLYSKPLPPIRRFPAAFGGTGLGLVITKRLVESNGRPNRFYFIPRKRLKLLVQFAARLRSVQIGDSLPLENSKTKPYCFMSPECWLMLSWVANWINGIPKWLTISISKLADHTQHGRRRHTTMFSWVTMDLAIQDNQVTLNLAKTKTDCLVVLYDCQEQDALTQFIRPNADVVLSLPVSEHQLARKFTLSTDGIRHHSPSDHSHAAARQSLTVLAVDDNFA